MSCRRRKRNKIDGEEKHACNIPAIPDKRGVLSSVGRNVRCAIQV